MRHILVVDDDLHTRLAIGIWLKQCGFRVAITDGGESGLAENMPQRALTGASRQIGKTRQPIIIATDERLD